MNANLSILRTPTNSVFDFVRTERMTMDAQQPPIHPIIPPPAIYDHAYKGRLAVRQGSMAQVEHYCHAMQGIVSPYRALGCSKVDEHNCFVMIPKIGGPVTASIQAQFVVTSLRIAMGGPPATRDKVGAMGSGQGLHRVDNC